MCIIYELRKILSKKMTLFVLAICMVINVFVLQEQAKRLKRNFSEEALTEYGRVCETLTGEFTEEKKSLVEDKYYELNSKAISKLATKQELGELKIYTDLKNKMNYIESYESRIYSVRRKAKENALYFRGIGNETL